MILTPLSIAIIFFSPCGVKFLYGRSVEEYTMAPLKLHDPKFQLGDTIESRSFLRGYRGAWFRCKITGIRKVNAVMRYNLEYIDFPDEKPKWIKIYQKSQINISKSKGDNLELMVRPSFPTVCHESERRDVNTISDVVVIVDNKWKVGDLVDWWTDDCFWTGRVTNILGNDEFKIDLLPHPLGEETSDVALGKDLRPSLDWCTENGWTVPKPIKFQDGVFANPCAQIIKPANSGVIANIHAADGASDAGQSTTVGTQSSSHDSKGLLDSTDDRGVNRIKQLNTATNGIDNDNDNEIEKTCFSDGVSSSCSMDTTSIGNNREWTSANGGYDHDFPSKKLKSNGGRSLGMNSMSSNTTEAAILDLEELVNRIKWLKGLLNFRLPFSGSEQPSWKFSENDAPCK